MRKTKIKTIEQGIDFLKKTETLFKAEFHAHDKYFPDDKKTRDIYNITLSRKNGKYTFRFGQSIANVNKRPTADVLAGLVVHDPGSFDDFCFDYCYDNDSIKAEKIYKAVKEEYISLCKLYTPEEMELLSEIS